ELLQMGEQLAPDGHHHVLSRGGGKDVLHVIELAAEHGEHQHRDHASREQRMRLDLRQKSKLEAGNMDVDLAMEKHDVEQDLEGPGLEQGDDRETQGPYQCQRELGKLWAQVAPEAKEDANEAKGFAVAPHQGSRVELDPWPHGRLPTGTRPSLQAHSRRRPSSPASRMRWATSVQAQTFAAPVSRRAMGADRAFAWAIKAS